MGELLKEIAPRVTRACFEKPPMSRAVDSSVPFGPWRHRLEWRCVRSACATPARSSAASKPLRASPKGGLIVVGGTSSVVHLRQIITLAARLHPTTATSSLLEDWSLM